MPTNLREKASASCRVSNIFYQINAISKRALKIATTSLQKKKTTKNNSFFFKKKTYVASESCRPMTPNLGLGPGMLLSELCHLASAFEKGRDRPRLRPCSELLIFTLYTTTKDQELKKEPRLLKLQIHTRG